MAPKKIMEIVRSDQPIEEISVANGTGIIPPSKAIRRSDETAKTSLLSSYDDDDDNDSSEGSSDDVGEGWERLSTTTATNVSSTKVRLASTRRITTKESSAPIPLYDTRWQKPYHPAPVVDQITILVWGFVLFGLSLIWPPLILLFAYGASKLIPYSFRTNDCPATRRKLFAEFVQQATLPDSYRLLRNRVKLVDSYWSNQRGMLLHTITMKPKSGPLKAVVLFCHGYTDNVSFEKVIQLQRFVQEGIAVCAIEYEGHGLSDGAMGLIGDFNQLVEDVAEYAEHVQEDEFPETPMFVMGESMGGAVAFSLYRRIPDLIRGVVFLCPMCKISDHLLPPPAVINVLRWWTGPPGDENTSWFGYLPIAPASGRMLTHKDEEKWRLASRVPLCFGRNPRLATARELIDASQFISSHMSEFDAPFLVLHGLADTVTDPTLSQALYDESKSKDKSIRLYEGMWHSLFGEPDENAHMVFQDCISWILQRVQ